MISIDVMVGKMICAVMKAGSRLVCGWDWKKKLKARTRLIRLSNRLWHAVMICRISRCLCGKP